MKSKSMLSRLIVTICALVAVGCGPESVPVELSPGGNPEFTSSFTTASYASQNRPDVRGLTGAVSAGPG